MILFFLLFFLPMQSVFAIEKPMILNCLQQVSFDYKNILDISPVIKQTVVSDSLEPIKKYFANYDFDPKNEPTWKKIQKSELKVLDLDLLNNLYFASDIIFVNWLKGHLQLGICPNQCALNDSINMCFIKALQYGKNVRAYTHAILPTSNAVQSLFTAEIIKREKTKDPIAAQQITSALIDTLAALEPLTATSRLLYKSENFVAAFLIKNQAGFIDERYKFHFRLEELTLREMYHSSANFYRNHTLYLDFYQENKFRKKAETEAMKSTPFNTNLSILEHFEHTTSNYIKENKDQIHPMLLQQMNIDFEQLKTAMNFYYQTEKNLKGSMQEMQKINDKVDKVHFIQNFIWEE